MKFKSLIEIFFEYVLATRLITTVSIVRHGIVLNNILLNYSVINFILFYFLKSDNLMCREFTEIVR